MNYSLFTVCTTVSCAASSFKKNWLDNDRLYDYCCNAIVLIAAGLIVMIDTAWYVGRTAYESGQIVRGWCDHVDYAHEFAPCLQVIKSIISWVFGVDRMWSAQNLPVTVATNKAFIGM